MRHTIDRCTHHRAFQVLGDAKTVSTTLTGVTTLQGLAMADAALGRLIDNARAARAGVRRLKSEAVKAERREQKERQIFDEQRMNMEIPA